MNASSPASSFITDGRVRMATILAGEIAVRDTTATAYDCAERAVRRIFGRWLLDHTAAVRADRRHDFMKLVNQVEVRLGLHRRSPIARSPSDPARQASNHLPRHDWPLDGAVAA